MKIHKYKNFMKILNNGRTDRHDGSNICIPQIFHKAPIYAQANNTDHN